MTTLTAGNDPLYGGLGGDYTLVTPGSTWKGALGLMM